MSSGMAHDVVWLRGSGHDLLVSMSLVGWETVGRCWLVCWVGGLRVGRLLVGVMFPPLRAFSGLMCCGCVGSGGALLRWWVRWRFETCRICLGLGGWLASGRVWLGLAASSGVGRFGLCTTLVDDVSQPT